VNTNELPGMIREFLAQVSNYCLLKKDSVPVVDWPEGQLAQWQVGPLGP
jgi:hypothetical protein